jgi:probable rRNA maturation factor
MKMRGRARHVKAVNLNRSCSINAGLVETIASIVLKDLKKDRTSEIDIVFTDDAAIKKLNRRYKDENVPTDVLSFAIDGREFMRKALLGEIFISLDTAKRNARLFDVPFEDEVVRYVVHGILHLFGYDDTTENKKARMWHKQEGLLKEICKQEDLSKVLTRH